MSRRMKRVASQVADMLPRAQAANSSSPETSVLGRPLKEWACYLGPSPLLGHRLPTAVHHQSPLFWAILSKVFQM